MNTIKIEKRNTLMVAHRGLSRIECENTSSAFVAAGTRSYYGIDCDIYRTADGRFVIHHDASLKRLSDMDMRVEEHTLAELQSIVLFDKDGTKDRLDLRPATLENYLNICKKYEKHCVIELKSNFTEEEIARIIDVVNSFEYMSEVTFISFWYDNLTKVRAILPDQSVQFLFCEFTDEIIEKVIADRFDIDVQFRALNQEIVDMLHANGLKVNCWTVDDKYCAEQLTAMGVDFITTNILE